MHIVQSALNLPDLQNLSTAFPSGGGPGRTRRTGRYLRLRRRVQKAGGFSRWPPEGLLGRPGARLRKKRQLAALCRDQEPNRGVRLTHPGIARSESAGPSLRVSSPGLPCLRQINRSERDRKCQTSIWRRKAKTARGSLPPAGGHRQRAGDRLPTYPRWPGRVP